MVKFQAVVLALLTLIPSTILSQDELPRTTTEGRPYCGKVICDLPFAKLTDPHSGQVYIGYESRGSFSIVSPQFVLTNEHVVRDYLFERGLGHPASVDLYFSDGSSHVGNVVAIDVDYDLALIQIQGELAEGLHYVPIAKTYKTERVTVCGYEGGVTYRERVGAKLQTDDRYEYAFRFDGIYKQGISGSPVLNTDGYLCGVLFGCDYDPTQPNTPNFGYATRVEFVREFLAETGILEQRGNQ